MRLIDADKLIEFIDAGHLRHPNELCFSEIDVVNMLNHAPTVTGKLAADLGGESLEEVVNVLDKQLSFMLANEWIPVTKKLPEKDKYILLSFENFSGLDIGRYDEDEDGGAFFPGDDEESYSSYGIFVNAWMELPKPYREKE